MKKILTVQLAILSLLITGCSTKEIEVPVTREFHLTMDIDGQRASFGTRMWAWNSVNESDTSIAVQGNNGLEWFILRINPMGDNLEAGSSVEWTQLDSAGKHNNGIIYNVGPNGIPVDNSYFTVQGAPSVTPLPAEKEMLKVQITERTNQYVAGKFEGNVFGGSIDGKTLMKAIRNGSFKMELIRP